MKYFKIKLWLWPLLSSALWHMNANAATDKSNNMASITFLVNGQVAKEEITLGLDIYEQYSQYDIQYGSQSYQLKLLLNVKKQMRFQLPANYSMLRIRYKTASPKPLFSYSSLFLLRPGDSVLCEIENNAVKFSGRGATRMQLQMELNRIVNSLRAPRKTIDGTTFFNNEKQLLDTELRMQLQLLQTYSNVLPIDEYNYFSSQCYGLRKLRMLKSIIALRLTKPELYKLGLGYFADSLSSIGLPLANQSHMASNFTDYLYEFEKMKIKASCGIYDFKDENMFLLWQQINQNYSGMLKEKLILIFFTEFSVKNNARYVQLLNESLATVSNVNNMRMLLAIKRNQTKGMDAYPFSLPDSAGRLYTLKDFEGKLVIMDFWFTGCMACENLAKVMIPIAKELKDEKVVFVTVSIDTKKEIWLRSLKSGKFTNGHSVNLYTEGKGHFHELIKHYNINSYPQLILIDSKGKLITSAAEIPKKNSAQAFIQLVRNYL